MHGYGRLWASHFLQGGYYCITGFGVMEQRPHFYLRCRQRHIFHYIGNVKDEYIGLLCVVEVFLS